VATMRSITAELVRPLAREGAVYSCDASGKTCVSVRYVRNRHLKTFRGRKTMAVFAERAT